MVNIGQSFGGIPVYFIRWNPDNYYTENIKEPENITKRYKLLVNLLKDIHKNKIQLPVALVSVLYLYYDGWTKLFDEEWKIISEMSE